MSRLYYPIIPIADNAPESPEQLGTKTKYWLHIDKKSYLFKIGRPNTGENWAEKVVCELCALLGLPHAHYDLAVWKQQKGVLSRNIVPPDGRLVPGNELLSEIHTTYPASQRYQVKDHTLGRIFSLLNRPEILLPLDWIPPGNAIQTAADVFTGYLLLDAWIANQDRHHENWGIIHFDNIYLAPTYDHAASLGQNETDARRKQKLTIHDQGHISHYVKRANSAIYLRKSDEKPLSTVEVFRQAATRRPEAAKLWQQRLSDITTAQCLNIFERIPDSEISKTAIEFAMKLLELNKQRLLDEKTP